MPAHNHTVQATTTSGSGRVAPPTGRLFATNIASPLAIFGPAGSSEVTLASGTNVVADGRGVAHNNMQPFLVVGYMIALQGFFPPRQ